MNKIITIPFTDSFIERLSEYIIREYVSKHKDLRRLAIVFGGHRPALFLKRELAAKIKGAFFPPRFYAIDEFISDVGAKDPRRGLLDLDHCFVLYQLAQAHVPQVLKGKEEFVHFLPWAREILNFIEQLDLEDTSADALNVLREHAAIGFNVPADINSLLEALMVLRQQYHLYLDEHKFASRGYRYLRASHQIKDCAFEQFDQVLFCNFFYLHRTEMKVIKDLVNRDKATLIMQGDQRRWPALSRIAQNFGQDVVEGKLVAPTSFNLNVYAALDMHAQAVIVVEILKTIKDQDRTVIVLPNADFMLPLLSAIGAELKDFNISLGYPLRRSSLYALLESIVQVHKTMKGNLYYARDYLRVLRHPLVKSLKLQCPAGAFGLFVQTLEDVLTGTITSTLSGQIFLDIEDILNDEVLFEQALLICRAVGIEINPTLIKNDMRCMDKHLFWNWKALSTFEQLSVVLTDFCQLLENNSGMSQYPFNERVAERLQGIAGEWGSAQFSRQPFVREDLLGIMQERLGRELVAFSGSPLKGLQVLGLLETRSLSFEHVIVADVNERILPNLNVYEPLIPREVMIKMSLDRLELEEEIQRYQFMRLISNAKQVHLIYQDRPDRERSRFIEELIWEQEQKAGQIGIVTITRPAFKVALKESQLSIPKTPEVIEFLRKFTFSASSVNMYMRNPYDFYQNYVLALRERQDLLDDPESRHIGTFIHDLFQDVFKPLIGKKPSIDAAFRRRFKDLFESRFHQIFGRGLRSDAFLIKAVLENRLDHFLEVEAERIETQVKELLFIERKFEDQILLSCGAVRFSYRVDRVERLEDGTILVLDYKTGGPELMPYDFGHTHELSRAFLRDQIGSVQMPLYFRYLDMLYPKDPVNCALYHLRTMDMAKFITAKTVLPRPELISSFLISLDFLMAEIFNPKIPFINDPVDIN